MSAFIEKIYKYDSLLSYRFVDLRSHQWFSTLMISSSKLGDGPIWIIISVLLLAFGGENGRHAVFLEAVSVVICVGVFKLLKNATSRKRPFETYPDLRLALPPPDKFSFPSGHSMNAFAIAVIIGYYLPLLFAPLLILALLVAASRVFLALHYPTDVIAGASVGMMVSAALIFFAG